MFIELMILLALLISITLDKGIPMVKKIGVLFLVVLLTVITYSFSEKVL